MCIFPRKQRNPGRPDFAMKRCPENPIVHPDMVKPSTADYRVRGAFNPGAVQAGDEIILLLRVAENCVAGRGEAAVPVVEFEGGQGRPGVLRVALDDPDLCLKDTRGLVYRGVDYLSTMSHIRVARSRDGVHFTVDEEPFLFPATANEAYGVEDARVTKLGEVYYITYTCVSPDGWATALASTRDFNTVTRHGIVFCPQNKDVSIFPERWRDRYHALHRPNNEGFGRPSIWYAESEDLLHWGRHRCVLRPRDTVWEEMKIGGGAPPIRTAEGWLQIYHGKGRGQVYSLFAVLLDPDEPWRVVRQGREPILRPETPYETQGFFPNVVFSGGMVQQDHGEVLIYYGACDETVCLLETSVGEILTTLR